MKVIDGSIKQGDWELSLAEGVLRFDSVRSIKVRNNIVSIDVLDEEKQRGLMGATAGGVLGFLVAGPLGTAVGAAIGSGGKNEITATIVLGSGEVFTSLMSHDEFNAFKKEQVASSVLAKPKEEQPVKPSVVTKGDEKECPMCAEYVKSRAKICRFCRYEFPLDDGKEAIVTTATEIIDKPVKAIEKTNLAEKKDKLNKRKTFKDIEQRIDDSEYNDQDDFLMFDFVCYDDQASQELEKHGDINKKDRYGATLLHYSCKWKSLGLVEELINRGFDVNALCDAGESPLVYFLHFADYSNGDDETYTQKFIQFLFDSGMAVNEESLILEDAIIGGLYYHFAQHLHNIEHGEQEVKDLLENVLPILTANGCVLNEDIITEYLDSVSTNEFPINKFNSQIVEACN